MVAALAVATGLADARAATFVVTTTADAGSGSFRQAITDANSATGLDAITFAIPDAGVPRITLVTPLPTVSDPVTIDGTTQLPGGLVELDGQSTTSAVGLSIASGGSTVRGLVIGAFEQAGILITGLGNNVVEGNLLGTDASGTDGRSPLAYGIEVSGSPANRIGGTSPGSGNLISGNLFGVFVHGSAAVGNVIEGNLIGTDASGVAALRNSSTGIWILGASATVIGGADPAAGNVIAGNGIDGVDIGGPGAVDTMVWGNAIGFGADLATPIGNDQEGVYVYGGAGRNEIGKTVANWIGNNAGAGVRLPVGSGTRNVVRANVILGNGGLGIDLGTVGVTPNDPADADTGANNLQNFPVLDPLFMGGTAVAGTLDGAASKSFVVEIFSAGDCDSTGHGEAGELLAAVAVSTDILGHAAFTATLSRVVDASTEYLTATATDSLGSTSEFSQCAPATLLPTTTSTSTSTTSTTSSSTTSTTAAGSSSTTTSSVPASPSTTSSSTTSTTVAGSSSTTTSSVPASPSTTSSSTTSTTAAGSSSTTTSSVPASPSTTSSSTTSTTETGSASTTTSSVPDSTSTTSSSTTSTTAAGPVSSTTTSLAAPTSTTTTLPGPCSGSGCGCLVEPTFDSVQCRLRLLNDAVLEAPDLQPMRDRLARKLNRAQLLLGGAQARCSAAKRGPARRKLVRVGYQLGKVLRTLQLERNRKAALVPLADTTGLLRGDTRTLARSLACR